MIYYDQDGIVVRSSTESDVKYLGPRLRCSDANEVWASHHHGAEESVRLSFEKSLVCLTIVRHGTPIGMFGINPESILSNRAVIWFLASEDIEKIKIRFLRRSKDFINKMLESYGVLYNWCEATNYDSLLWLKMLGAKIEEPAKFGMEQRPFRYFEFVR